MVLLRAQRDIDQVIRVHAGGRHGAPRARREAGRCDSSAPRSPCRSGRRGGTDCDCGGDRAIRAGAGRAGDRGGADRAGRSRRAAATATTFERRRRRRGPSAGERARGAAAPGACRPSAGRGVDRVERAGAKTGAAACAAFDCRRRRRWLSAGGRARGAAAPGAGRPYAGRAPAASADGAQDPDAAKSGGHDRRQRASHHRCTAHAELRSGDRYLAGGRATNETEPARIVAASLNPKVLKAAVLLVTGRRVRSAKSVRREHIRMIRGFIDAKKLDPLFYQTQAVERARRSA